MFFLAPLWLLGLLPWGGLVLWLLWGRRPRVMVPFVALWQITAVDVHARRNLQTPPVAVALVIVSLLLALLGAAGLVVRTPGGSSDVPITLVLDRGASMSAHAAGNAGFRFHAVADEMGNRLIDMGDAALPIHLIDVGDGTEQNVRADQLAQTVHSKLPTLMDTEAALRRTLLQQAHAAPESPTIVITDQSIETEKPDVLRIAPAAPVRDVGIERLVVRRLPSPQVMVTLSNRGMPTGNVTMRVSSDDWQSSQTISLPPESTQRDYFINAERLGDVTRAELVGVKDDFAADDRAVVVREGSWAAIEVRGTLDPAMKRLIDVYQAHRPATAGSPKITIVNDVGALGDDMPGLVLAATADAPAVSIAPLVRENAAALNGVDLSSLPGASAIAPEAAPPWPVTLSGGGHVLVAAREEPARQVWVGFNAPAWASSPDFVIFFSSCLDWIAAGGARDVSHPPGAWEATWRRVDPVDSWFAGPQPGVYRLPDGGLRALALAPPAFHADATAEWSAALDRLVRSRRPGVQLSHALLLLALLALLGALATWKRRSVQGMLPGHLADTDASIAGGATHAAEHVHRI